MALEDYFDSYAGKVNFIKIDIEGAEKQALNGMLKLLDKNRNIKIIIEFWPISLKRSGCEPADYLDSLIRLGFKLYNLDERVSKLLPISTPELINTYNVKNGHFTNLLCIKGA